MLNQININLYRTFVIVAESKTFAEAAEKMDTTDKAISNDINSLEKQLGIQLFYRKHKGSNNGLKITEQGEEIYPKAKKIISDCDFIPSIIESGNSLENGKLTIGCPSHITEFFLMEKLIELVHNYPNIEVKLDTESDSRKMIEELKNNEIDVVILDTIPDEYKNELEIDELEKIENIFVANRKIEIDNLQELQDYRFILSYDDRVSTKRLWETLQERELKMKVTLKCPTTEQRISAAKGGVGLAYIMKEAAKKEIENGELYEVKMPIKLPSNSINIVYLKNRLTKVDKAFIKDYLKKKN